MKYILAKSNVSQEEIKERMEYIYDIFHIYTLKDNTFSNENITVLKSIPENCIDLLMIIGHDRSTDKFLIDNYRKIKESNIAAGSALADIQASLYNQSQDANSRQMQSAIANTNDFILNNKYDNAILIKDLSNQVSNSVAALGNQIANQTATITNLFNEQTIDRLRDSLATTRDELSNVRQTGIITSAINNQTNEILNAQGRYYMNPPCYQGCGGCCNGLY